MSLAHCDDLSKLDDGPTAINQLCREEVKIHGFSLNLDKDPALIDYNRKIETTLLKMIGDGRKKNTRRQVCNTLKRLNRKVDLMNPEAVKMIIGSATKKNPDGTTESLSDASKQKLCNNYDYFVIYNNLSWQKPVYVINPKVPPTPTNIHAHEIARAPNIAWTSGLEGFAAVL